MKMNLSTLSYKKILITTLLFLSFTLIFNSVYASLTIDATTITSDGALNLTPTTNTIINGTNVGIGVPVPAYKLDVAGDVNVTGDFKINGTNIGAVAGASTATNVLDHGAIGDGVTDDTVAIRAAITAAGVNGTVLFPASKTFLLSGFLQPLTGQTFSGYGAILKRANQVSTTTSTSIITGTPSSDITVADASGFRVGMHVTVFNGASFDPNNHLVLSITGNVIQVGTAFSVAFPSGGTVVSSHPLVTTSSPQVTILGLELNGNKANNTLLTKWENHREILLSSDYGAVRDCYVHDAQAEGIMIGGIGVMVEGCSILASNGNAVHFSDSSGARVVNNYVKDCNLAGAVPGHADGCIIFSNVTGDSIVANNYIDNGISCVGSIDSDDNSSVIISQNICHNATAAAIEMILPNVNASKVNITDNFFYNSAPITISNTSSSPTANTGPSKVSISGNYMENTRIAVSRAFDISITDNTLINLADTTNIGISIYYCKRCVIASNLIRGFGYGIYVDGVAGQLPESINIHGNTLHNQMLGGIRTNIASTIGIVIQANTIQTDASYASASYAGILISNGVSVLNNILDLQSGQYGILCPNGGATTQGAIVSGNVIRSAVTASIRTNGGSQKNIITNNFVQQAIQDGGTPNNTVTGNITIL